jgi:hypothetical protein
VIVRRPARCPHSQVKEGIIMVPSPLLVSSEFAHNKMVDLTIAQGIGWGVILGTEPEGRLA